MIPDKWFDPEAPVGVGQRHWHAECSEQKKDKALIVTRTAQGWVWYCHRCQKKGFKSAKTLAPGEAMKWIKSSKVKPYVYTRNVVLPEDFTLEIPVAGKAWLYHKGITDADMAVYHFGYSAMLDRVILPVYDQGTLKYWTGRYLGIPDKEHPKYSNVFSEREGVYFKVLDTKSNMVVLVEDILSAVKVGAISDCYALLSIFIPDQLMFDLSSQYDYIYLWLDRDKWDRMTQYVLRYKSFGINVKAVRTLKDPKLHTKEEIACLLNVQVN